LARQDQWEQPEVLGRKERRDQLAEPDRWEDRRPAHRAQQDLKGPQVHKGSQALPELWGQPDRQAGLQGSLALRGRRERLERAARQARSDRRVPQVHRSPELRELQEPKVQPVRRELLLPAPLVPLELPVRLERWDLRGLRVQPDRLLQEP
jgi:hypothetical protein